MRPWDVNVRGTLLCLRYELAIMLAAGGGAIVNNASLAGLVGSPDNAIYDASKHAVVGLTRSAALEVEHVRESASTPYARPAWKRRWTTSSGPARASPTSSWRRPCRSAAPAVPEEVAPAVLFLCSDEASYITGAVLAIDGGFSAR